MPVLGYELLTTPPAPNTRAFSRAEPSSPSGQPLPTLLAKLLVAFAVEFETRSNLSLAVSANLLRLTADKGIRVRDLPRLSGVSKEAMAMALRRAEECGLGSVQKEAGSVRVNAFTLTPAGRRARQQYRELTSAIEIEWAEKYGRDNVAELRELAERIAGSDSDSSVSFQSLQAYPDGWRASIPAPDRLAHYPMVLHRGGFPDGS